jgi:hypothetical protein
MEEEAVLLLELMLFGLELAPECLCFLEGTLTAKIVANDFAVI